MSIRKLPGTRVVNAATGAVIYTPPEGESLIREKLRNWEEFIHGSPELDPLVRMAVAHYQFEAIHPFDDGNGRTGRILNLLMLVEAGLIQQPILYMSRSIIATKDDYYRKLHAVTTNGDWEAWITYMLHMVEETSRDTISKIEQISELQEEFHVRIREALPLANNADFLAVLFEQPYCRIRNVVENCGVSRQTASTWLHGLVEAGVLVSVRLGREVLFINTRFLEVLTRRGNVEARVSDAPRLF